MNVLGARQGHRNSLYGAALLMIVATSLWGVSFVAPLILNAYSPMQITFGRFFFYGIISIAILLSTYSRRPLGVRAWIRAGAYGLAGNILFSILVSFGIQDTGAEVCIPMIGLLPICVSIAGNRHLPAATWRRLLVPFAMITVGLGVVLVAQSGLLVRSVRFSWPGVAAIAVTVIVWTWYAISNSRFLRENPDISSGHWSSAIGVATFVLAAAIAGFRASQIGNLLPGASASHPHELVLFVAVTLVLGVGASWLATILFNRASHALPMTLVGQLIVLETIFGIAYVCLYQRSLPPLSQACGMALSILGIWLSARELLKS